MKSKLINDNGQKTWAIVFDTDDEFMAGMEQFAKDHGLDASQFTAIGAFRSAVLGFFDMETKDYRKIPVDEQTEVLALVGDVAPHDGKPKIHAHVVLGLPDGTTRGGHILEARVRPTLEVILTESPKHLRREIDEETDLPLIRI